MRAVMTESIHIQRLLENVHGRISVQLHQLAIGLDLANVRQAGKRRNVVRVWEAGITTAMALLPRMRVTDGCGTLGNWCRITAGRSIYGTVSK